MQFLSKLAGPLVKVQQRVHLSCVTNIALWRSGTSYCNKDILLVPLIPAAHVLLRNLTSCSSLSVSPSHQPGSCLQIRGSCAQKPKTQLPDCKCVLTKTTVYCTYSIRAQGCHSHDGQSVPLCSFQKQMYSFRTYHYMSYSNAHKVSSLGAPL